jgi:hypothetical protein
MTRGVVAVIAAGVLLAGCSAPPTAGTVIAKQAYLEEFTMMLLPQELCTGKSCLFYFLQIPVYYPPAWSLTVQPAGRGKPVTFFVSEATYQQHQVGDHFVPDAKTKTERPYVRREKTG